MNTQLLLQLLQAQGLNLASSYIVPALAAIIVKNPTWTNEQLVSNEDGSLKHYVRTKIGFFVDLFWGDVEPYVEQAITAAIPQARELSGVADPAGRINP